MLICAPLFVNKAHHFCILLPRCSSTALNRVNKHQDALSIVSNTGMTKAEAELCPDVDVKHMLLPDQRIMQGVSILHHVGGDAVRQQAGVGQAAPQAGRQLGSHRPVIAKMRAQLGVADPAKCIVGGCRQAQCSGIPGLRSPREWQWLLCSMHPSWCRDCLSAALYVSFKVN